MHDMIQTIHFVKIPNFMLIKMVHLVSDMVHPVCEIVYPRDEMVYSGSNTVHGCELLYLGSKTVYMKGLRSLVQRRDG